MEIKCGKIIKSLEFFFSKLQKVFISEFCFILAKYYSISTIRLQLILKEALFLHFQRSLLITYLITLSLEKEIIVLQKNTIIVYSDLKIFCRLKVIKQVISRDL